LGYLWINLVSPGLASRLVKKKSPEGLNLEPVTVERQELVTVPAVIVPNARPIPVAVLVDLLRVIGQSVDLAVELELHFAFLLAEVADIGRVTNLAKFLDCAPKPKDIGATIARTMDTRANPMNAMEMVSNIERCNTVID